MSLMITPVYKTRESCATIVQVSQRTKDWRGDRVVDGNGLENRRGATHREFESRPLRQAKWTL